VGYAIAPSEREISSWDIQSSDVGETIQSDVFVRSPQGDITKRFRHAKHRSDSFASH
jgi:hypothetical protein